MNKTTLGIFFLCTGSHRMFIFEKQHKVQCLYMHIHIRMYMNIFLNNFAPNIFILVGSYYWLFLSLSCLRSELRNNFTYFSNSDNSELRKVRTQISEIISHYSIWNSEKSELRIFFLTIWNYLKLRELR